MTSHKTPIVKSQWVGDVVIDTKQSYDQQPGSFTHVCEKDRLGAKSNHDVLEHLLHLCCKYLLKLKLFKKIMGLCFLQMIFHCLD